MDISASDPVTAAFIVIPVLLVLALVWGTAVAWRRGASRATATRVSIAVGAAAVAWMAATWTIAQTGVFRNWQQTPPPFGLLIAAIIALSATLSFSSVGWHLARFLPLWVLVAVQGFRLPLELAMHEMYARGIMPREMTYTGRNFDILTGITAIVVAGLVAAGLGGRRLVTAWNVLGLALLLNVVGVAVLATPRFQYFGTEPLNVWVTYPPFVWLPAVMVLAALAGHLVIFSALRVPEGE